MNIEHSDAYKALVAAVERDEVKSAGFHDYRAKLQWIEDRAQHYAEKTGLAAADILTAWEGSRDYWYMNYYQDANQPKIEGANVRVFDTMDDLRTAIGDKGFRCPACEGASSSAYTCDTGIIRDKKPCDWKSWGLFGTLGKGINVFVKSEMKGENVFMPLAFEAKPEAGA